MPRRLTSSSSMKLFLAGLGSATEVHFVGSIAITELVFFVLFLFVFFKDYNQLRHDGFLPYVWLTILTCTGCVISGLWNGTYPLFILKSLAMPAVYLVATIMFHRLLRQDISAMKWYLVGLALSNIVCIFIFQPETYTVRNGVRLSGMEAAEAVLGYATYTASRVNEFLKIPINCFYLSAPSVYSWFIPVVCAGISMAFSQASGRSAAAASFASGLLIFFGGKSRRKISWLSKNIWLIFILGLIGAVAFKATYTHFAKSGALGEAALKKYEKQTATGTGFLNILMAGRMELFCGLQACIDYPIIGLGSRAEDRYGYTENYLRKYASQEDYDSFLAEIEFYKKKTGQAYTLIPAHSHLVQFWLWFGIFGLLLWLYVFGLMIRYMCRYASAIPQWYGYMCLTIPAMCWNILFSPPGGRMGTSFFVVCLLFCKAVSQKKMSLPIAMELEIQNARR